MPNSSLVKKLLIKPGQRVAVLKPPPGFLDRLEPLPDQVELHTKPFGKSDFVLLFVRNKAELNELGPKAIGAVKPDGLLWIAYQKKSAKVDTDLTRDVGWSVVDKAQLEGVALVSIDEVWSAMRFRPRELVGKKHK